MKLGAKLGSKLAANRPQDHDLHPNLMKLGKLCPPNLAKVWQQGPASFNIMAKTDVCTLPINMLKLIIVYVT